MNRLLSTRAFTLIEILVVVAILAILALIVIPNLVESQVRSKVARAKADMRTIATAMEAYATDKHQYPPDFNANIYPDITVKDESLTCAQLTTPVAYITSVPRDPFHPDMFEYFGTDAQQHYSTPANMEAWKQTSSKYFVYSFGPDKKNDRLPANLDAPQDYSYDPTNGTVSPGDFGRSNSLVSVP